MASGGHVLVQQRSVLETKIKTLVNNDLKEICKMWNHPVSGTKVILQKRCIDILDNLIGTGDVKGIDTLKYRFLGYKPNTQIPSSSSSNRMSAGNSYPTYQNDHRYNLGTQMLPPNGRYFKPSPFYEITETIVPLSPLPDGAEMPQNRHTIRQNIILSVAQADQLTNDKSMKLMLYCGLETATGAGHLTDVAFPNQIEVKVNNDDVRSNYKGLKNKPGSTKPAELTNVRTRPGYANQLTINYALTTKRYAYAVHLVKYISSATLTERIKSASVIPKQVVIDEMTRANADPDIEATSTRMSLKDPISTVRITLPVRSTVCKHNQCFDGAMFMQLQEQAPQWSCPVCSKTVPFQSLCVDKYFEDILNRTPRSIEKVDVEPNGEWRMIKEEDDQQPNGTSNKPRASYDDDFDDDLVEVLDPVKPTASVARESQPANSFSPSLSSGFPLTTPPLSSREASVSQSTASAQRPSNKRPAGAVIDLTLSDEDDEPPRPAKRHQPSAPAPTSTNSYNTPGSLPDQPRYQSWYPRPPGPTEGQGQGYRSTSHSAVPQSPHGRSALSQSPVMRSNGFWQNGTDWTGPPSSRQSQQYNNTSAFSGQPSHGEREGSLSYYPGQQRQQQPPSRPSLSPQQTRNLALPPMQTSRMDSYHLNDWRGDHGSSSGSPGG